jgi:hypothetical protein
MKTNMELVAFCKKALNEKWGYVWGTFGQQLTQSVFAQKIRQYPREVGRYERFIKEKWLNRRTADCVGLIKGALWEEGGKISYDPNTDMNANSMILKVSAHGPISSIPELPGILVWKQGHIGVYVGDGWVIEANSTKKGVIKTPLTGPGATAWTKWGRSTLFSYEMENVPELKEVYKIQQKFDFLGTKKTLEVENIDGYTKIGAEDLRALGLKVEWDDKNRTVIVSL